MASDINWWKLSKKVSVSKCVPSVVVLSSFHQDESNNSDQNNKENNKGDQ